MRSSLTPGEPPAVPLRGELRYGLELARLMADREFLRPVRRGRQPAVLLVPGFMAGDQSLGVLPGWLRRRRSVTARAGILLNTNCAERAVEGIEPRLRRLADDAGGRVVLIGQSRGGASGGPPQPGARERACDARLGGARPAQRCSGGAW